MNLNFWKSSSKTRKIVYITLGLALLSLPLVIPIATGQLLIFTARYVSPTIRNVVFYKGSPAFSFVSQKDRYNALSWAIHRHFNSLAAELIENGASLDHDGIEDRIFLRAAAMSNNIYIAKILVARGVDPNDTKEKSFSFPLATAALENNIAFAEFLIANGADVNKSTEFSGSALALAKEYKIKEMEAYLISKGGKYIPAKAQGPSLEYYHKKSIARSPSSTEILPEGRIDKKFPSPSYWDSTQIFFFSR